MHTILEAFEDSLVNAGFAPYVDKDGDLRVDLPATDYGVRAFVCITCDKDEDTGWDRPQFFHLSMFTYGLPSASRRDALEFLDYWNLNRQMLKFVVSPSNSDLIVSLCHGYMRPEDGFFSGVLSFLTLKRVTEDMAAHWYDNFQN